MPKLDELNVGDDITLVISPITREMIREFGKAGGDQNPIHMDDKIAEKFHLKGVIGHALMNVGFFIRMLDEWLKDSGSILEISMQFRGKYRPGDTITTLGKIISINDQDKEVDLEIVQKSKTPLYITKNDVKTQSFEADTRGWVSEKDIQRNLITNEMEGDEKHYYRVRNCTIGTAQIKLNS